MNVYKDLFLALIWGSMMVSPVWSQSFSPSISVHPESVSATEDFLILIDDSWPDSCLGEFQVEVTPEVINITATANSQIIDDICLQVQTPFQQLINPLDELTMPTTFSETITVNYFANFSPDGPFLAATLELTFSEDANLQARIQSGAWVTPTLDSSGLFIDQQDNILTAALMDYDEDGDALWRLVGGQVNGNVFIGDLFAYQYFMINCVTVPCPQISPIRQSRVYMLLNSFNELFVNYNAAVGAPRDLLTQVVTYRRLQLARNPEIPQGFSAVPDLSGRWVTVVRGGGDLLEDQFKVAEILFQGPSPIDGVTFAGYFGEADPSRPSDFSIACGETLMPQCFVRDLIDDCGIAFDYSDAGIERVANAASCDRNNQTIQVRLELLKIYD